MPSTSVDGTHISAATLKSVLRQIDDHAFLHGVCWASSETIALETCLSERTVRRSIKAIEALGFVSVDSRIGQTKRITINWNLILTPDTISGVTSNNPGNTDHEPRTHCPPTPDVVSDHPGHTVRRSESETTVNRKGKRESNSPPSLEVVVEYWKENSLNGDPERFFNHYEGNGWMQGKQKLKKWQSAAQNWSSREPEFKTNNNGFRKQRVLQPHEYGSYNPNAIPF